MKVCGIFFLVKNIMYQTHTISASSIYIFIVSEERLYWIEGEGNDDIYSCDLDGGNMIIFLELNFSVQDLKVFGYYLYYIKRNEK